VPSTVSDARSGVPKKRSLLELLTEIPVLVRELVAGEIELLKQEMIRKLKALGVGAGLILGAVIVLLGVLGVLLTAGILALALVLPGWLAALLVAVLLLIIAGILALVGFRVLKKGIPPLPTNTIDGLKKDLNVIRGVGKRE
jgi:tetrahydromethanopterin S-methyltransferase subunit C